MTRNEDRISMPKVIYKKDFIVQIRKKSDLIDVEEPKNFSYVRAMRPCKNLKNFKIFHFSSQIFHSSSFSFFSSFGSFSFPRSSI
jgi:hypothetical protein